MTKDCIVFDQDHQRLVTVSVTVNVGDEYPFQRCINGVMYWAMGRIDKVSNCWIEHSGPGIRGLGVSEAIMADIYAWRKWGKLSPYYKNGKLGDELIERPVMIGCRVV